MVTEALPRRGASRSAATLARTTFETSRLLEFFTEKELTMQIGHPRHLWPLALCKELIDNALDACESAGVAPNIAVRLEADALTVADNGPGLPASTLERSLDYLVRVSDKAHYVSPTRGQLGNALKCLWAAPYVVDGEHGQVEVWSHGQHQTIDVRLDRIAQAPRLILRTEPEAVVKTGTVIRVHWPGIACCLDGGATADFYNTAHELHGAHDLLNAYAAYNPHGTFSLQASDGSTQDWPATTPAWTKWQPSDPTSAHWYTPTQLRALIAAYLTTEGAGDRQRTVREFIAEFRGLSGTAKQKAVAESAGLAKARLVDLTRGGDVDLGSVSRLLAAMQAASRPVAPAHLGTIGEAHLTTHLVRHCHAEAESVRYKRVLDTDPQGVPFVLEVAFGVYRAEMAACGRTLVSGINWSPTLSLPFGRMPFLVGEARADEHDPVVLVAHLASPHVQFRDRGKVMLDAS